MALKLHCIFENSSVLPDIIKLVEKTAHKLNAVKKSAKVADVYDQLRDDGFEIDAESVAFAYQNIASILGKKNFSTTADLNRFGGAGMKQAIEIANKGDITKARLGRLSIPTAIAKGIATTFSTLNGRNDVDKSKLFTLQEMMRKKAASMLDKSKYPAAVKMGFKETLEALFAAEDIGAASKEAMKGKVKGAVNTIDEVWDGLRDGIAQVSRGIKDRALRDQFNQMTDAIVNSSYDLLLSTKQADDVIKDVLKEIGYTKTINKNGNPIQVVDWNKVLASREDWKDQFANAFKNNGFNDVETQRIINTLDGNYTKMIQKQSEIALSKINKNNNKGAAIQTHALEKLVKYKNAGINLPANKQLLLQATGVNIPTDVANQVMEILNDYEAGVSKYGNISNVYVEEVIRSIRNLLSGLDKSNVEKVIDVVNDYVGLRAITTVATTFNAVQNITSGLMASTLSSMSSVFKTGNPKLIGRFMKSWIDTFRDVSGGGVTIRDARTVNALEQLQGRGGLSDRWTYDTATGFWGRVKATLSVIGQVTATAADAANGTVIYQAGMIQSVKEVLKGRGLTGSEANRAIDDIIFGKQANGMSNRKFWTQEATKILTEQEGVKTKGVKARRIAEEMAWHGLITDFGITIEEVKAVQSASLEQKSKNLGHESDVILSPAFLLNHVTSSLNSAADRYKKDGNKAAYLTSTISMSVFKTMNMFVGGKANWAILALQNSPIGVVQALGDMAVAWASSNKGEKPTWRQPLAQNDPEKLTEQLAARKAIYGRLERGVYGTVLQSLMAWGIMSAISGGGDDDKKKRIVKSLDKLMQDPNTKRFLDKAMPLMLAAELSYAYDPKANALDKDKISDIYFLPKYEQSFSGLGSYLKKEAFAQTGYDKLQESYKFNEHIKNDDKRAKANSDVTFRYIGQLLQLPYVAWYDIVGKEVKVVESGITPDPAAKAKQKKEFKDKLKKTDGAVDAFTQGVGIDLLYERFKSK